LSLREMTMMMSEEEEGIYERFQELCSDLNLDSNTKEVTWTTYAEVRSKYTLEVTTLLKSSLLNAYIQSIYSGFHIIRLVIHIHGYGSQ
jgi:hypothetical protein